jgi:cytoskeletal protein RodZ
MYKYIKRERGRERKKERKKKKMKKKKEKERERQRKRVLYIYIILTKIRCIFLLSDFQRIHWKIPGVGHPTCGGLPRLGRVSGLEKL